jgi:hypothetical protein
LSNGEIVMRAWLETIGGAAVACACTVVGCSGDGATSDLEHATSQWHAAAVTDYVFVYQVSCFCDARRVRAVVHGGRIASATFDDGSSAAGTAQTVDDWFGYVRDTIARSPAKFSVTYDDKYGYPKQVRLDVDENSIDDELTLTVSCFQPATNDPSACPLAR